MKKTTIKYIVDILLLISFLVCFITGLIKWPGLINLIGVKAWRVLHFHGISNIHDFSGLIMGLLVIVHIVLNWKFLVAMTKKTFFRRK